MGRHSCGRLGEVEVVSEFLAVHLFAFLHAGHHAALCPESLAERGREIGVLGNALHEDGAGAGEGSGRVTDGVFRVEVLGGFALRIELGTLYECVGERLKPCFARYLCLGAALGLEGQVDVLQPGLGVRCQDGLLQFWCQLSLGLDGFQDRTTAVGKFPEVAQPLFQVAELAVIQRSGGFLAVPGNERDR